MVSVIDVVVRFEFLIGSEVYYFLVIVIEYGCYVIQVEFVDKIVEYYEEEWDEVEDLMLCIECDLVYGVGKKDEELCFLFKLEVIVLNDL